MQPSIDDWVKENLRYDPETGYLWWTKQNLGSGTPKNLHKPAGCLYNHGYISVESSHKGIRFRYYAHRLAWFLYYGVWPKNDIDHINNVRDDNRLENLREATRSENSGNQKVREGGPQNIKEYLGINEAVSGRQRLE
jgi:hypothetical protein